MAALIYSQLRGISFRGARCSDKYGSSALCTNLHLMQFPTSRWACALHLHSGWLSILALALWLAPVLLPNPGNAAGLGWAWAQDQGGDDGGDDGGAAGAGGGGSAGRGGDGRSDSDSGSQEPTPLMQPGRFVAQELVGLNPSPAALRRAAAAGLRVVQTQRLPQLGLDVVRLRVPPGLDAKTALALMEERDPGVFDLHHRFKLQQSGALNTGTASCDRPGCQAMAQLKWPASSRCGSGQTIGLVDGPVAESTALSGADWQQRRTAPPDEPPASEDHGTAVASLLVGQPTRGFQGLLPAAKLRVAAPFYRLPNSQTSADALDIATSLEWLASQRVSVIGMSLSGPANRILAAAVRQIQNRGILVVAAVGNDGRAAEPAHPAALPDVIGATALSPDGRLYWRAGQGQQVDFALPGVAVDVMLASGQVERRNGTSYAAPYLVALVSQTLAERQHTARQWIDGAAIPVRDLGATGRDEQYGWGLPTISVVCK